MRCFVCWPTVSITRSNDTAREWARMGWQVAVAIDADLPEWAVTPDKIVSHVPPLLVREWGGYYSAVSYMARALCLSHKADIVVAGADNIYPDPQAKAVVVGAAFATKFPNGFGVLQPIRDAYSVSRRGDSARDYMPGRSMHATPPTTERCESPVLGRAWILDMYQGKGPYSEKYRQYFGDVELHDVAQKMGVLWKNPQILHRRDHWARPGGGDMQPHQRANFDRWYEKDYAMYRARRHREFPESERRERSAGGGLILPSPKLWKP